MHDFNNYKQTDATSGSVLIREEKLQFDLMRNIPSQVEKFFEIQHFDFDNSNALLLTPDETTNLSSSDSSTPKRQDSDYYNALGNAAAAAQIDEQLMSNGNGKAQTSPQKEAADGMAESNQMTQTLTAGNLAHRDSLMMMDEEARNSLMKEIDQSHKAD